MLARRLRQAADAIGTGLYTLLFLVFLVQIGARFGFNRPLPWTDEAAVVLYVWVILWAAAFMVPPREQVAFDLVWNLLGPQGRRVAQALGALLMAGLVAWGLPGTWDYVQFMQRERTPVLDIPFMWVYLPLPLLLLALLGHAVRLLWYALKGGWRRHAARPESGLGWGEPT